MSLMCGAHYVTCAVQIVLHVLHVHTLCYTCSLCSAHCVTCAVCVGHMRYMCGAHCVTCVVCEGHTRYMCGAHCVTCAVHIVLHVQSYVTRAILCGTCVIL